MNILAKLLPDNTPIIINNPKIIISVQVSWVRRRGKDEIPELLTVGAVTYAADNRVTVARRYPGNWRLLIRVVKPDDEGVYECQISTHPPRVSKTYLHINSKYFHHLF